MNTIELFKKDVLDSEANHVGRVVDLIFELPPGVISHLVVKTGLISRLKVGVNHITKVGDTIVLNVPKKELEAEHSPR